ncbi:hypothetical protein ATP06_0227175 [Amycolatopsis regifaucium]|uniref:SPW repeat-containing integral membrane domain-containing protein n=1 Tax=Amycolatopsis regifaucium TaxID=546365 RepID=A0ABX3DLR1_9PSEU|nr:hypothetical protein ATP06_0227175 [Amycolatopsis regifaucium]
MGIIDALTYLAGVWLILTPFVLNSPFSEGSADGDWNAILVGSALVALGALSLVDPPIGPTANLMRLPLGGWLAVSPLLLGAESGAHPAAWAVANVVTGPLVLVLWGAGLALVHRAEAGRPSGSRAA